MAPVPSPVPLPAPPPPRPVPQPPRPAPPPLHPPPPQPEASAAALPPSRAPRPAHQKLFSAIRSDNAREVRRQLAAVSLEDPLPLVRALIKEAAWHDSSLSLRAIHSLFPLALAQPVDVERGMNVLHLCVVRRSHRALETALALAQGEGMTVDLPNSRRHGQTALHLALIKGDAEAAEMLLCAGASPSAPTNAARGASTALQLAITRRLECVEVLLAHGAVPTPEDLVWSAARGSAATTAELLPAIRSSSVQTQALVLAAASASGQPFPLPVDGLLDLPVSFRGKPSTPLRVAASSPLCPAAVLAAASMQQMSELPVALDAARSGSDANLVAIFERARALAPSPRLMQAAAKRDLAHVARAVARYVPRCPPREVLLHLRAAGRVPGPGGPAAVSAVLSALSPAFFAQPAAAQELREWFAWAGRWRPECAMIILSSPTTRDVVLADPKAALLAAVGGCDAELVAAVLAARPLSARDKVGAGAGLARVGRASNEARSKVAGLLGLTTSAARENVITAQVDGLSFGDAPPSFCLARPFQQMGASASAAAAAPPPPAPLLAHSLQRRGAPSARPQKKAVRIFLSSTFVDLERERDAVIKVVLPHLQAEVGRVRLVCVDLRWGVTAADSLSGRACEICLEEVERSDIVVALHAGRVGWVPTPAEVPESLRVRFPSWADGASLTTNEVLLARALGKTILAFTREPQGAAPDIAQPKVSLLSALAGIPTAPFGSVDALVALLKDELGGALRDLLVSEAESGDGDQALLDKRHRKSEQRKSEAEVEAEVHRDFALARVEAASTAARRERLVGGITRSEAPVLCVHGSPGFGKSTVMALAFTALEQSQSFLAVVPLFVGASPASLRLNTVLMHLADRLRAASPSSFASASKGAADDEPGAGSAVTSGREAWELAVAALAAGSEGPVAIVIDALNQISGDDAAHSLAWLPAAGVLKAARLRIILSTTPGDVLAAATGLQIPAVAVGELSIAEREAVLEGSLAPYRKVLTPHQIALVLRAPDARSPLYLTLCCEELRVSANFEGLDAACGSLPGTVLELLRHIIARLIRDHGEAVHTALCLVGAGRSGILESDLLALLGADNAIVVATMRNLLLRVSSNGVTDFLHSLVLESVRAASFPGWDSPGTHSLLADHYGARPDAPFHLLRAGREAEAQRLLLDPAFLQRKIGAGRIYELVEEMSRCLCALPADSEGSRLCSFVSRHASLLERHPDIFLQQWELEEVWAAAASRDKTARPLLLLRAPSEVNALAISSELVIAGCRTGAVFFSRSTGKEERQLAFEAAVTVRAVALLSKQGVVVTGDSLGRVLSWTLEGVLLPVAPGEQPHGAGATVRGVSVDPQRGFVATCADDGTAARFSVRPHDGRLSLLERFPVDPNPLRCVCAGHGLVLYGGARRVVVVQPGGAELGPCGSGVDCIALASGGTFAFVGTRSGDICGFSLSSPLEPSMVLHFPAAHSDTVTSIAVVSLPASPSSSFLVSTSLDRRVKVWRRVGDEALEAHSVLTRHGHFVNALAVEDGAIVATAGADMCVKIFGAKEVSETRGPTFDPARASGQTDVLASPHSSAILAIACNRSGSPPRMITTSWDRTVRLFPSLGDTRNSEVIKAHRKRVNAVAIRPAAGPQLEFATGGLDGLYLHRARGCAPLWLLQGVGVFALTFSHDGRFLLAGLADGSCRVLHLDAGSDAPPRQVLHLPTGSAEWVTAAVFSPFSRYIFAGNRQGHIFCWDSANGLLVHSLTTVHARPVLALDVAYDPRKARMLLVSASEDRSLAVLNTATGALVWRLTDHTHEVGGAAFWTEPGGALMIASAAADKSVRLWSVDSGSAVAEVFLEVPLMSLCLLPGPGGAGCLGTSFAVGDALGGVYRVSGASGGARIALSVEPVLVPEVAPSTSELDVRSAVVVSASHIPDSRMHKLLVDVGEGRIRTIASSLARWYTPEELQGMRVVVLANLEAKSLRGVVSEGMLLGTSGPDGKTELLIPPPASPPGARIGLWEGSVAPAAPGPVDLERYVEIASYCRLQVIKGMACTAERPWSEGVWCKADGDVR